MIITLDKFSAEELNLMSIFMSMFNTSDRETLVNDLVTALHGVKDLDMIELFRSVLEKLEKLNDEDFAKIGFHIADEDD